MAATASRSAGQAVTARCGPALEDRADHPGAGAAGADLDEDPDAVVIGPADDGREVEPVQRVGDDRLGGRLAVTA